MLNIRIEGDKVVINNLRALSQGIPEVAAAVLGRVAAGVHREAFDLLSGPAATTGGYPVPVVTGNLRRLLNWLNPGETKMIRGDKGQFIGSFRAGDMEAIVYNSAAYGRSVHQGTRQHSKYGARPYLTDALARFNSSGRIEWIAEEELDKELRKHSG